MRSPPIAESSLSADAPQHVIIIGDLCKVVGLAQRDDLNGKQARVLQHDPLRDVWHVIIEGHSKKMAIRVRPQPSKHSPSTRLHYRRTFTQTTRRPPRVTAASRDGMLAPALSPSLGALPSARAQSVNLKPHVPEAGTVPSAAMRRTQRTARAGGHDPSRSSSPASPAAKPTRPAKSHRKLSPEEREAAVRRLCAPVAGRPAREKAVRSPPKGRSTERSPRAEATESPPRLGGLPLPIEARAEFVVPRGRQAGATASPSCETR